uniref:Uncharacterized protein n=1 Tax=Siphoviridae sp. ctGdK3 TaxID=2826222 RepID=A0A8S5MU46_9CAUD|nr:MAG TPA: hypothetical protein [Siphoviridae sp. ctGdK3]
MMFHLSRHREHNHLQVSDRAVEASKIDFDTK